MQIIQNLKKNGFTYVMVGLTLIVLIASFTRSWDAAPAPLDPDRETAEVTTEATTEATTEVVENPYFFIPNGKQSHVIGLRPLEQEAYPKAFKFTKYDLDNYSTLRFYEVALLELSTENSADVINAWPLHLIHYGASSLTETVYRQMAIRYEDDFAIYTFDRETFVTALDDPKIYRTYTLYGSPFPVSQTEDSQTLKIFESTFYFQTFDTNLMQFITKIKPQENSLSTSFDWDNKTVTHLASDIATHGPPLSRITDEPRLKKIVLKASTDMLFEALGNPLSKGWLMGDYLTYEDFLVYSVVDEKDQNINLYPIEALIYYGDYPVAGVKNGMPYASVEQILGIPEKVSFSENNELAYPLMLEYTLEGFNIGLSFNADLEVANFFISVDEWKGEKPLVLYEPFVDEIESAYSPDKLSFEGLYDITDFTYTFNASFFNASNGFYRYDLTRSSPERIHQEPMRTVFEIQYVANPSLIAVGKNDGILYKIDLNSDSITPFSGPNYKDYYINMGTLIKQSLVNDDAVTGP